jgi:DNA-binding transcriptional MerR regulator
VFGRGESAHLGRVSVRMLRHDDALGLLRPARVDVASGYRYYREQRVAELQEPVERLS